MKTTEVNKELIGRRCECIFTGLMVTGVIEDIQDDQHSIAVKVRFDHPHQWGDDLYNDVWAWGRKIDEFGTLHHLQLLEDKPDFQIMTVGSSARMICGLDIKARAMATRCFCPPDNSLGI